MNATDRIDYTRPFAENVKGQLYARFELGPNGEPLFVEDEDGLRYYAIDVFLHSPRAKDIFDVRYIVDDPTYDDPVGFSGDRANDFPEFVQSYGELPVIVKVQIGPRVYEQRTWLSQMLENGHAKDATPAIQAALQQIKLN